MSCASAFASSAHPPEQSRDCVPACSALSSKHPEDHSDHPKHQSKHHRQKGAERPARLQGAWARMDPPEAKKEEAKKEEVVVKEEAKEEEAKAAPLQAFLASFGCDQAAKYWHIAAAFSHLSPAAACRSETSCVPGTL